MEKKGQTKTSAVIKKYESELLGDWISEMNGTATDGRISVSELRPGSRVSATVAGGDPAWQDKPYR
jgi:hypothetical protein